MAKLIARMPILIANRIYQPGETLPAQNAEVVDAWITAGSAALEKDDAENTKDEKVVADAPGDKKPKNHKKEKGKK